MKTNENLKRGKLKDKYIGELVVYFRKFIEAYEKQGIPIYAMTLQNEPLLEIDYPSMYMPPSQQRKLALKRNEKHVIDTKIWIYDHNASGAWNYIPPILDDKKETGRQTASLFTIMTVTFPSCRRSERDILINLFT